MQANEGNGNCSTANQHLCKAFTSLMCSVCGPNAWLWPAAADLMHKLPEDPGPEPTHCPCGPRANKARAGRAHLAIANIQDTVVEGGAAVAVEDTAAVQLQGGGGLDADSHWLVGHRLLQGLLILMWHVLKSIDSHRRPATIQSLQIITGSGIPLNTLS